MAEIGRNDPCPCGSGKKYKACCLAQGGPPNRRRTWVAIAMIVVAGLAAVITYYAVGAMPGKIVAGVGAIAVAAYLVFGEPPTSHGHGDPGSINFGR